jgi:hypothetical protein
MLTITPFGTCNVPPAVITEAAIAAFVVIAVAEPNPMPWNIFDNDLFVPKSGRTVPMPVWKEYCKALIESTVKLLPTVAVVEECRCA